MTVATEWEAQYAAGKQNSTWPWTDLVSLVMKHSPDLQGKRVLELGCGVGANIPFFRSKGAKYIGMEGSATAAAKAMAWSPSEIVVSVADFTDIIPYSNCDLVIDRSSITHNDVPSIQRCLHLVWEALKPGGLLISVDWFSKRHADREQFKDVGAVHFAEEGSFYELLWRFDIISLEEKIIRRVTPARGLFASWNLVARKK